MAVAQRPGRLLFVERMMKVAKTHYLKILPNYFTDVINGVKRFELRKNDRGFKVGDVVILRCYKDGYYDGFNIRTKIIYMLEDFTGLQPGYCILGLDGCLKLLIGEPGAFHAADKDGGIYRADEKS